MTAALVLAGTRPGGDQLAEALGVAHKCLIELDGEPLLQRVIRAIEQAGIPTIAVSCAEGPVADLARELGARVIPSRSGPSESVAAGFALLGAPMLVTTSDHALLDPQWIRQLIGDTPETADLSVMLARRDSVEQALPGSQRTYLRFADGQWSGCNLFYLRSQAGGKAIQTWKAVEADRKRPWRIAARLGPSTLLSMGLRRLTLQEGLARLGKRIGVEATLIPACDGLAAVDVDKMSDLETVRDLLSRRAEESVRDDGAGRPGDS